MNKVSIIVLVFAAVAISVNSAADEVQPEYVRIPPVILSEPYAIIKKQGRSLYSDLGHVPFRSCGKGRVSSIHCTYTC